MAVMYTYGRMVDLFPIVSWLAFFVVQTRIDRNIFLLHQSLNLNTSVVFCSRRNGDHLRPMIEREREKDIFIGFHLHLIIHLNQRELIFSFSLSRERKDTKRQTYVNQLWSLPRVEPLTFSTLFIVSQLFDFFAVSKFHTKSELLSFDLYYFIYLNLFVEGQYGRKKRGFYRLLKDLFIRKSDNTKEYLINRLTRTNLKDSILAKGSHRVTRNRMMKTYVVTRVERTKILRVRFVSRQITSRIAAIVLLFRRHLIQLVIAVRCPTDEGWQRLHWSISWKKTARNSIATRLADWICRDCQSVSAN